jgi:hypothetical protein
MQLYKFRLGKALEPYKHFTLEDLDVQFSCQLNERNPVLAQMFVHLQTPKIGRSWQITQQSKVPSSLISYSILSPDEYDCVIAIDNDLHASIRGHGWRFADMVDFLVEHCGNIMLDRNLGIGNQIWASVNGSDPVSRYHADPRLRDIYEKLQNGLSGSENDVLSVEDLVLIYMGKVEKGQTLGNGPISYPVYLGLILLRQQEQGHRYHWVRVGICTWYVAFDELPPWALYEGVCW